MTTKNLSLLTSDEFKEFCDSFDTILTDCDGVLWLHMNPLPNAANVINAFTELGKNVFYVTNNSTKTRQQFVEKCDTLNFKASIENIICTANLTASYLKDLNFKDTAYIIGSEAIAKELEEVGISHCGVGPDPHQAVLHTQDENNKPKENIDMMQSYTSFKKDPNVGAVIVGFDAYFSYPKMLKAATYLNDNKVHFIGTNRDERFPISGDLVVPGTGSLVQCIECCSEREAVVMGKPENYIAQLMCKRYNINPERTLMIGDRLNTDILFGKRCGFKTLLVLTGVTSLEYLCKLKQSEKPADKELIPDYLVDKLGDLLPFLQNYQKT